MPGYEASLTSLLAGVAQPLRDVVVTGLTMDSRQAAAGLRVPCLPGPRRTRHLARRSRGRARRRGRAVRAGAGARAAGAARARRGPCDSRPRAARRRDRGSILPPAVVRPRGRGHYRHQRQDDHRLPARAGCGGGRAQGRLPRHHRVRPPGRARRRGTHDARLRHRAPTARGGEGFRREDHGARGVVARARPGPRGCRALRHGGVHQPDA